MGLALCKRNFFDKHIQSCQGVQVQKTLVDRAVEKYLDMIATGFAKTYNRKEKQAMISGIHVYDKTLREVSLNPGWSR